jgi:predicted dehydrogenase
VDALAATEIATILRLAGLPQAVAATACRREGSGPLEAVFLTLFYASGLTALAIVSMAEASPRAELTVVTEGRTLTLDEDDLRATLRIALPRHPLGSSRTVSPEPGVESTGEHSLPQAVPTDPFEGQARAFIEAVASGDAGTGNASLWCQVALVWETARESMTLGGAPVVLPPWSSLTKHERAPPLRLMEGGGSSGAAARRRPTLTLVTS